MNAIELSRCIIELRDKSPGTLYTSEIMEGQDKTSSDYLVISHNHAPEIAKLFLEAVEILDSIGNDFYNKDGKTIKDFSRESLEETIINDTNMAKSFVEMVKVKK